MEELLLRTLLPREELDVVDQQCIQRTIRSLEIGNRVVLQALDHVADKAFRVYVTHACARISRKHHIADCLHQVGLSQPDAPVDEQRVVGLAGVLAHLVRRGPRKLVTLALDECREGESRVQTTYDNRRGVWPSRLSRAYRSVGCGYFP